MYVCVINNKTRRMMEMKITHCDVCGKEMKNEKENCCESDAIVVVSGVNDEKIRLHIDFDISKVVNNISEISSEDEDDDYPDLEGIDICIVCVAKAFNELANGWESG